MITYHPSVIRKRIYTRKSLDERFWQFVQKTDGCWLWTGKAKTDFGYGVMNTGGKNGKVDRAHRVSWMLHNGPIEDGMCVCHTCDNPACVRPDHLFLGTRDDNNKDMQNKGRCSRTHQAKGERHGMAKLTESDIPTIIAMRNEGHTFVRIASHFGVGHRTVRDVFYGRKWTHINRFPQPKPMT